ncbi:MAG: modF, partial [Chitinophagaceae bacterium]|nr:modF [Chitinophagaceae bacterium]
ITCEEVVTSGFNDQVGSSQAVTPLQQKQALRWMDLLHIKELREQNLYDTSLGEQRLVLLARALVKNPALLILDEPCQGLDAEQTKRFTEVIDAVCTHFNKTLIYISHYAQDIPKCVTHVLTLEKGKVV